MWFVNMMLALTKKAQQLRDDESGAALIEYTVLLALMLIATIATITLVGQWVAGRWTALNSALPSS